VDLILALWVVVLLYVVGVAGLTSWVAESKSRSAGLWFLVGIVFGPLAMLAVGLAEPNRLASAATSPLQIRDPVVAGRTRRQLGESARLQRLSPNDEATPIGTWLVRTAGDERLSQGETIELGLGARFLIVRAADGVAFGIERARADFERVDDLFGRLMDGDNLVAVLDWVAGPNARQLAETVRRDARAASATDERPSP
jgi:hypothetical protein